MLGQVDHAHAARADAFQDLVLADAEAAPLALEQLLRLKVRQQPLVHHVAGGLFRIGRQAGAAAPLRQKGRQALRVGELALVHQREEFIGGQRRRHQLSGRRRGTRRRTSQPVR